MGEFVVVVGPQRVPRTLLGDAPSEIVVDRPLVGLHEHQRWLEEVLQRGELVRRLGPARRNWCTAREDKDHHVRIGEVDLGVSCIDSRLREFRVEV